MTSSKYKFFREQEESPKFTSDEINGDLFYIPKDKQRLNPALIELSEYSDSELQYRKLETSAVDFSSSRLDQPPYFVDKRIQVRQTPTMGLGCFATEEIDEKTIIESSPVILVHKDTFINLNLYNGGMHKLSEYPFNWGIDAMSAISLGYGSLYNHKIFPNVSWKPNWKYNSMQFITKRKINSGEELFIRYLPLDRLDKLWFDDEESEIYSKQNILENKNDISSFFIPRSK